MTLRLVLVASVPIRGVENRGSGYLNMEYGQL